MGGIASRPLYEASSAVGSRPSGAFEKSAMEFEGLLIRKMLDSMMPEDASSVYGKGPGCSVWRSMLSDAVADILASSDTLGLKQAIAVSAHVSVKEASE